MIPHVIVCGRRACWDPTPDLKDDGSFDYHTTGREFGNVENAWPDGATLGNATTPGFELIDTRTLKTTELTANPALDSSVSNKVQVTDIVHWTRDYRTDLGFITYAAPPGRT